MGMLSNNRPPEATAPRVERGCRVPLGKWVIPAGLLSALPCVSPANETAGATDVAHIVWERTMEGNLGGLKLPSLFWGGANFANPVFFDIDADQDEDLFLGHELGTIIHFRNLGSPLHPVWDIPNERYGSIQTSGHSAPAFADIDGDGDADLFVGDAAGRIAFCENTGTPTTPQWGRCQPGYAAINLLQFASPVFGDVDGDGDQDLVVGDGRGAIHLYTNTGTVFSASWSPPLTYGVRSLHEDLMLYFSFDGADPATVMDESGRGHDGAVSGAVYAAEGYLGGAYQYDGLDDLIWVGDIGSAPHGGFSFWMYPDVVESHRCAFATKSLGGDAGIRCNAFTGGRFLCGATKLIGNRTLTTSLTATNWHHVAMTWDDDHVWGYLNGTLRYKIPHTGLDRELSEVATGTGYYSGIAARKWKGKVDELRIYGRTLTGAEAFALYQSNIDHTSTNLGTALLETSNSVPALADLDRDGDLDLLVGYASGRTLLYHNVGSRSNAVWTAPIDAPEGSTNDLVAPRSGFSHAAPAVVDFNGDGAIEILIGGRDNTLFYANGRVAQNAQRLEAVEDYFALDTGRGSRPAGGDIDADGDVDLLVDTDNGNLFYYENTGSPTQARWAPPHAYGLTAPTNGLALYYTFNSTLSGTLADESGHGHSGRLAGSPTAGAGIYDGALVFSNAAHVDAGDILDVSTSPSTLSVCLWMKGRNVGPQQQEVVSKQHPRNPYTGWRITTDIDGHVMCSLTANFNNQEAVIARDSTRTLDDAWHFVVAEFHVATNILRSTLYVDGYLEDIAERIGPHASTDTDAPLRLAIQKNYNSHFEGWIDEFRIYTRSLTEDELHRLYKIGDHGPSGIGATLHEVSKCQPALFDLDRDGDLELLLGRSRGDIVLYENIGTASHPVWADPIASYLDIHVGACSSPTVADIDGDADPDLLVGEAGGGLNLWRNQSASLPIRPASATRTAGAGITFHATGEIGAVTWTFLDNQSGGTLNAHNGSYTAGTNTPAVDTIEARDSAMRIGRAYINVIDPQEAAAAGKAILIAGGLRLDDPVWEATKYIAHTGYRTLLYRGYAKTNIAVPQFWTERRRGWGRARRRCRRPSDIRTRTGHLHRLGRAYRYPVRIPRGSWIGLSWRRILPTQRYRDPHSYRTRRMVRFLAGRTDRPPCDRCNGLLLRRQLRRRIGR